MENTLRKINGKEVNPISDLIIVEKLDWSKLNGMLNEYLHERFPERADEEFYFDEQYSGFIEIDKSTCLLITREAIGIEPEILNLKNGIIGFIIGVMVQSKIKGVINVMPEFDFSLKITKLPKMQTGDKLKLPDFMGSRYKYNPRVASNETQIIDFLEKCNYKLFPKKIKTNN